MEKKFMHRYGLQSMIMLVSAVSVIFSSARAGTFSEIKDFGKNPTNLKMFLYTPTTVKPNPAVLVGIHWCHGTANSYYTGNKYRSLADKYGFLVIYPNANSSDSCFDVHSPGTLHHDSTGDAGSIISMVKYVIKNNGADSTRVFVTGHSSGGMMTNVMIGSYPEVFKAGSASAGVPFGCFAGTNSWSDDCAKGKIKKTPGEWGDLVRAAYPGYSGPRPRIQFWHGSKDDILDTANFWEEIDQWTNVLGVSQTPASTETNKPLSKYIRMRYTNASGVVMVEAVKAVDQGHNCTISEDSVIAFFGLDKTTPVLDGPIDKSDASGKASLSIEKTSKGEFHFIVSSRPGRVTVDVFDLGGVKIMTLADQNSPGGLLRLSWNPTGKSGAALPSAVYVLSVKINGKTTGCRSAALLLTSR